MLSRNSVNPPLSCRVPHFEVCMGGGCSRFFEINAELPQAISALNNKSSRVAPQHSGPWSKPISYTFAKPRYGTYRCSAES